MGALSDVQNLYVITACAGISAPLTVPAMVFAENKVDEAHDISHCPEIASETRPWFTPYMAAISCMVRRGFALYVRLILSLSSSVIV